MATAADLDFDPVELLESELRSTDRARRLRAVKGLNAIAVAVGADAARNRVVPIVEAHVAQEEEDEVQFRAATALDARFVGFLGGPEFGHLVLPALDRLCRVEETTVRLRAVRSLRGVLEICGGGDSVCASVREVVATMSEPRGETAGFGAKASAAALCAAAHGYLERVGGSADEKRDVRLAYAKIAADDAPLARGGVGEGSEPKRLLGAFPGGRRGGGGEPEPGTAVARVRTRGNRRPQVRASAVCELAAVCTSIKDAPGFVQDLSETVTRLLEDEHDVVRLEAVAQLGGILGSEAARPAAVAWSESVRAQLEEGAREDAEAGVEEPWYLSEPSARVVHAAHGDASWRVRGAVARAFGGYCSYLAAAPLARGGDRDELAAGLLSMFAALFDDPEVEVRAAAFGSAVAVAGVWPGAVAAHADLLEAACRGAEAPELKVRLAAASTLTKLLGVVAPGRAAGGGASALADAQARVFEVVEARLFSDEHVDVVLATLRELEGVVPALEPAPCGRVAALAEASTHENWRVRAALLFALPALAVARGRDAFETQLLEGFVRAFQDRISQVRTTAVLVLGRLRDLEDGGAPPAAASPPPVALVLSRLPSTPRPAPPPGPGSSSPRGSWTRWASA